MDRQDRRWFSDDYFDLIVWVDRDKKISGFQLCYDKTKVERALAWTKDKGYNHERIDMGKPIRPGTGRQSWFLMEYSRPADHRSFFGRELCD